MEEMIYSPSKKVESRKELFILYNKITNSNINT